MHQPYYRNLLTGRMEAPWVRLHGIKDYLDMVLILKDFPKIQLTFNLVPSLLEQIEDYAGAQTADRFFLLSYKRAVDLTEEEKKFILDNFFGIYPEYGIAIHPRYYLLYLQHKRKAPFNIEDFLDLQVWFNLAWFDPYFRQNIPQLRYLTEKARFFTEEEKILCLDKQKEILAKIIPTYKELQDRGRIEITTSPFYHPILPLLYNTKIAKEANPKTKLPRKSFSYPDDGLNQIKEAVRFYQQRFGKEPFGLWPSEEAVSEHILPLIMRAGIKWVITDEGILLRSLKKKKRATSFLYKPYQLERKEGKVFLVFRDRNLSDSISFVYHRKPAEEAVTDFINHLRNINETFKNGNPLVCVALDGENAWEYYKNDGRDFLKLLYQRLSQTPNLETTTVSGYLKRYPAGEDIKYLKPGSWVYGNLNKWIGSPLKNKAWEELIEARKELEHVEDNISEDKLRMAWKQIYILEGSDWFWWYDDTEEDTFDKLFHMHLSNFYKIIEK